MIICSLSRSIMSSSHFIPKKCLFFMSDVIYLFIYKIVCKFLVEIYFRSWTLARQEQPKYLEVWIETLARKTSQFMTRRIPTQVIRQLKMLWFHCGVESHICENDGGVTNSEGRAGWEGYRPRVPHRLGRFFLTYLYRDIDRRSEAYVKHSSNHVEDCFS